MGKSRHVLSGGHFVQALVNLYTPTYNLAQQGHHSTYKKIGKSTQAGKKMQPRLQRARGIQRKKQDKTRQDASGGGDRARGDTHRQRCRRRRRPSRALRRSLSAAAGRDVARPVRLLRGRIGGLRLRVSRVLRVRLLAQLPRSQA